MLAISCLYKNPLYAERGQSSSITRKAQVEALKWSGQSLEALRLSVANSEQTRETVLLSCILLSALQSQQNDIPNALPLLRAGFNLACDMASSGDHMSPDLDLLIHTFLRQGVLLSIFGCDISQTQIRTCWQHINESYTDMQNLSGARDYLFACMLSAITFINSVATARYRSDADYYEEVVQIYGDQQREILESFARWYRQFMSLTTRLLINTTFEDQRAISSMMIHYHVCRIWTIACLARSSLILDSFTQQFSDVLIHAENLLQTVSPQEQPFNFEIGAIAPLSFVAGHCRHPLLRRKAINLIRKASMREALFTAEHSARAAELLVALEETPRLRRKVETGVWDGTLPGPIYRCQYVNEPFRDEVPDRQGPSVHYLQPRYSTAGEQNGWTRHSLTLFGHES